MTYMAKGDKEKHRGQQHPKNQKPKSNGHSVSSEIAGCEIVAQGHPSANRKFNYDIHSKHLEKTAVVSFHV